MPRTFHVSSLAQRVLPLRVSAAFIVIILLFTGNFPVKAQSSTDTAATQLILELNALQPVERGCRFTFMISNDLDAEISQAAFELALFNTAGMISRLTIVDFKDLPAGKTKVRQFDFPDIDCNDVGRVLVNDAPKCAGSSIAADTCIRYLSTRTTTNVVFGS